MTIYYIIVASIVITALAIAIAYSVRNMDYMPTYAEVGPVFNNTNPYRAGAFVYVMELDGVSDEDWSGMVVGIDRVTDMVMVRDNDSNVVAYVNRDQVFGVDR